MASATHVRCEKCAGVAVFLGSGGHGTEYVNCPSSPTTATIVYVDGDEEPLQLCGECWAFLQALSARQRRETFEMEWYMYGTIQKQVPYPSHGLDSSCLRCDATVQGRLVRAYEAVIKQQDLDKIVGAFSPCRATCMCAGDLLDAMPHTGLCVRDQVALLMVLESFARSKRLARFSDLTVSFYQDAVTGVVHTVRASPLGLVAWVTPYTFACEADLGLWVRLGPCAGLCEIGGSLVTQKFGKSLDLPTTLRVLVQAGQRMQLKRPVARLTMRRLRLLARFVF